MAKKNVKSTVGIERTFVLIKPDGVQRGLIGEVIGRFETRGLKVIAMKMIKPSLEHVDDHYPKDEAWIERLVEKGFKTFAECGIDPLEKMGTNNKLEAGKMVRKWLLDYILEAPVIAMVVEGYHAIDMVRKIIGPTIPSKAELGTIRGDYSTDSPIAANLNNRAMKNIVHASEDAKDAVKEIALWFSVDEIHDFELTDHAAMY